MIIVICIKLHNNCSSHTLESIKNTIYQSLHCTTSKNTENLPDIKYYQGPDVEAVDTSEMFVNFYQITQCYNPSNASSQKAGIFLSGEIIIAPQRLCYWEIVITKVYDMQKLVLA
jgi:hypothetical protein